jgi:hypothetical protein
MISALLAMPTLSSLLLSRLGGIAFPHHDSLR